MKFDTTFSKAVRKDYKPLRTLEELASELGIDNVQSLRYQVGKHKIKPRLVNHNSYGSKRWYDPDIVRKLWEGLNAHKRPQAIHDARHILSAQEHTSKKPRDS